MMTQPGSDKKFRTITLEEHFATPEFMQGPGREMSEHARSSKGASPLAFINAHLVDNYWISMLFGLPTWMLPASTCKCFP